MVRGWRSLIQLSRRIILVQKMQAMQIKYILRSDCSRFSSLKEVSSNWDLIISEILCGTVNGSFCVHLPGGVITCPILAITMWSAISGHYGRSDQTTQGPNGLTSESLVGHLIALFLGQKIIDSVRHFIANPFMPSTLNSSTSLLIRKR